MENIQIKTKLDQKDVDAMTNIIINAENSPETCSAIFLGTKFEDNKITQIGNIIGASNILISDIVFALLKLKNKDFVDIITISLKLYDYIKENQRLTSMICENPIIFREVIQQLIRKK